MKQLYLQAAAALNASDLAILQDELAGRSGSDNDKKTKQQCISHDSTKAKGRGGRSADTSGAAEPGQPAGTSDSNVEHAQAEQKKPQHDWPLVGAVLTAEYYGQQYRAVVIPARKKLLSGRQLKIESGPAAGEICDSLSAAMILATEAQRRKMNLRRKGVANGWDFWQWEGK